MLEIKKKKLYSVALNQIATTFLILISYYIVSKLFVVNSWFSLIFAVAISSFIGIIINFVVSFNKNERNMIIGVLKKINFGRVVK
jgi:hypothetical protein